MHDVPAVLLSNWFVSAFEAAGCDAFNEEALEGKEDDENRNDGKNTGCHDQSVLAASSSSSGIEI